MTGLTFTPLSSAASFCRLQGTAVQFDPAIDAEVLRMWNTPGAHNLTDELVLRAIRTGDAVELSPIRYRYLWAQKIKPDLFAEPLTSLAVSGVTWCDDRLLVGRRADWVSQDASCLELVPSGSVDADVGDLFAQIDREMSEELGIPSSAITSHRLLGIVDDQSNHVRDAVIETRLTCSFAEVQEAHARLERPEYSELRALTVMQLRDVIDRGSEPISAVSRTIFAQAIEEA